MVHALDMGISAEEFWDMTPRGICLLVNEMLRAGEGGRGRSGRKLAASGTEPVKLCYIPRP